MLGVVTIALTLLSLETALGLVFDPRYRDIPFAPQSAAVFAFLVVMVSAPRPSGTRSMAETLAAAVLALCAVYIAINETFANWQAIWLCAGLLGLGRYSGAGAGRARLRIKTPAANAERSALCSTMPNPAAASASEASTIDGRIRLRTAATSATAPNTS